MRVHKKSSKSLRKRVCFPHRAGKNLERLNKQGSGASRNQSRLNKKENIS